MSREVVATPVFARHLTAFLDGYAEKGAVRFLDRLERSYVAMLDHLEEFEDLGRARRRTIGGKTVTAREYVLEAGARDFLVLYVVPAEPDDPIVLLNIRSGGPNRFRWKE